MNRDIAFTETLFSHFFAQAVAALTTLLTLALALLGYDWRLTLALLCGLPLAVLLQHWLKVRANKATAQLLSRMGDTSQALLDWVAGIVDIRLNGAAPAALSAIKHRLNAARDQALQHEVVVGLAPMLFILLSEAGFLVFLLLSLQLYFAADISLAVLLVFLVISTRLYRTLAQLAITLAESRFMDQAVARLRNLLQARPLQTGQATAPLQGPVCAEGLSFQYPDAPLPALEAVSFTAQPGEITVIAGSSGSGKSTLLHLLARFWQPGRGSIQIGDQPLNSHPDSHFYRQVALVSQDSWLLDDSVLNNLRLARPDATDAEIEQICRRTHCHDFICQLPEGYHSRIGEAGGLLSGGERQRLALARALLTGAHYLLLDEISSALDVQSEQAILALLQQLRGEHSLIMIAHRETLAASADQVLFLQQGHLVASGHHPTLLASHPAYRQLWGHSQQAPSPTISTV